MCGCVIVDSCSAADAFEGNMLKEERTVQKTEKETAGRGRVCAAVWRGVPLHY